jgi:mitochondrial fission protein ELM1
MDRSDRLAAPWPDLVITIGRRHAMAALWIKERAPATKIVLLGRPRRWIERFDLIIVPPQYHLPDLPQVMRLTLPLVQTDNESIAHSARLWASRLKSLPRPIIAVLIGGATRPFRFDADVTDELLAKCGQLQSRYGGTLYFSTSRRTAADIVDTLRAELPEGARLYEWQPGRLDNPYLALLKEADFFVVTGDSVSMMIEVADRKRPLAIYQLPVFRRSRIWQSFCQKLHSEPDICISNNFFNRMGRLLYRTGLVGFTRDLTQIHETLIAGGHAVQLGEPFSKPSRSLPNELDQVRQRILALLSTCEDVTRAT